MAGAATLGAILLVRGSSEGSPRHERDQLYESIVDASLIRFGRHTEYLEQFNSGERSTQGLPEVSWVDMPIEYGPPLTEPEMVAEAEVIVVATLQEIRYAATVEGGWPVTWLVT